MKKIISLLLTLFILLGVCTVFPTGVYAADLSVKKPSGSDLIDSNYPEYEYVLLDDNTAKITFYQSFDGKDVTVPSALGGHKVTEIGTIVFRFDTNLLKLTFQDGLKTIGHYAASGCSNLQSLNIPDTVTTIGDGAFYGCRSISNVYIPKSVTSIGEMAFGYYYDEESNVEDVKAEKLTIIGSKGSAAERYANDNGFIFEESDTRVIIPVRTEDTEEYDLNDNPKEESVDEDWDSLPYQIMRSGKTGECDWTLDSKGTLVISGNGFMKNYLVRGDKNPWTDLSDQSHNNDLARKIKSIIVEEGVRNIGYGAFSDLMNLKKVTLPSTLESISNFSFSKCSKLEEITIPENVTEIRSLAFENCINLRNITVSDNISIICNDSFRKTAFMDDPVNTVDGVVYLGNYLLQQKNVGSSFKVREGTIGIAGDAFKNSDTLKEVILPSSVSFLGDSCFEDCTNLDSINLDHVKDIGSFAFCGCAFSKIEVPDSVISIGSSAFSNCKNLTDISLPQTLTELGTNIIYKTPYYNNKANWTDGVLYYGTYLLDIEDNYSGEIIVKEGTSLLASSLSTVFPDGITSVKLPGSILEIKTGTFDDSLRNLKSVEIGEGTKRICSEAFFTCNELTEITLPSSIESIDPDWLYDCVKVENINVNEGGEFYLSESGVLYNKDKTKLIRYPQGKTDEKYTVPSGVKILGDYSFFNSLVSCVELPDSLIEIGDCAFNSCVDLERINLPDSLTKIGRFAFYSCQALEGDIVIPSGITEISDCAFGLCNHVKSFTIPQGVKRIGNDSFGWCSAITAIEIPASVTEIGEYAFDNLNNLENIKFSEGLVSIGECAFRKCESLESVAIPASVKIIEEYALGFYDPFPDGKYDSFVIEGYEGSEAQKYAQKYEFKFKSLGQTELSNSGDNIPGDVNGDGDVDMKDVTRLQKYINKWNVEIKEQNSDVNGDGDITMKDIILLQKYINKWDVVLK